MLAYHLTDKTQDETKRNRQPERTDLLDDEESNLMREWAAEMLECDKQLNDWETIFLKKISKSSYNLTERQGDKIHDMYENFKG